MYEFIHLAAFQAFPYIAIAVMVVGSLIRFDREQYTWKSGSSQLLRRGQLMWGSNLFHIGILGLFLTHLFGLLTPLEVFHALGISNTFKQWMAIVVGGLLGLACFAGMVMLIHRRLADPRIRKTSNPMDIGILLLLFAQLVLGLFTIPIALNHLDGHVMANLMHWAQAIVYFQPGAVDYVINVHPVYKLHLFLGLVIFLLVPFSRLVHIFSAPVGYLFRSYQVVRTRKQGGGRRPVTQRIPTAKRGPR